MEEETTDLSATELLKQLIREQQETKKKKKGTPTKKNENIMKLIEVETSSHALFFNCFGGWRFFWFFLET